MNRPAGRIKKGWLYPFFCGAAMGAADVVPGVSGGTMAFILGVYNELIGSIRSVNFEFLRLVLTLRIREAWVHVNGPFILPLAVGVGTAFVALASAIVWLLTCHPVLLYSFFTGLILASMASIGRGMRWRWQTVLAATVGTVAAWMITGLIPMNTPHHPVILFFSGMLAISAMLLPGISGSFILLILGQYTYFITAVTHVNIPALLPLVCGMGAGIVMFARVVNWLLARYYQVTISLLMGFMLGSLRKIWPFKETLTTMVDRHGQTVPVVQINVLPSGITPEVCAAAVICIAGFLVIYVLDRIRSEQKIVSFRAKD